MRSIAEFLGFCDGKRWGRGGLTRHSGAWSHQDDTDSGSIQLSGADLASPVRENEGLRPYQNADLELSMQRVAADVKPWERGCFRLVNKLQDAVRNKGQVDQMRMRLPGGGERMVAVKRMPTSWVAQTPKEFQKMYPTAPERPWCDMAVVRELHRHGYPFVCEPLGVFRDRDYTYVAASLASRGDLFTWCDLDPQPGPAREENMRPLIVQIFSAIMHLHEIGIAHRDLSLENILLTDSANGVQVQVIDFGMCTASQVASNEVRGKQSYQAPEMHLKDPYDTFLVDSFALGVTLYAMAAQDYPWTATKRNACQLHEYVGMFGFRKFLEKRKLRKGRGEHLLQVFSPSFVDLLEGLLQKQPRQRFSLGESCFSYDVTGFERGSVWECEWMGGAAPLPGPVVAR